MSRRYYRWRELTEAERKCMLAERKFLKLPWHSPPHFSYDEPHDYHVTAACYEHQPYIGHSLGRMEAFAHELHQTLDMATEQVYAWCVLPNHYHLLVRTKDIQRLAKYLGQLHGRASYDWNGMESARGRKVFHRASGRAIRSSAHFWATVNYIHHNPVHHGYVEKWLEWPWSSAIDYMKQVGRAEAERIWREFPVLDYGKGWDEASL